MMMIVDPPSIFWGMWGVIKPLLPIKTQQKAVFVDSRQETKTREQLLELFDDEMTEFLLSLIKKDA